MKICLCFIGLQRTISRTYQNIEQNIIDDINISFDIEGKCKLTEEDLERININRETNKIFKTFIPYMLTYKLLTDVSKIENI